MQTILIANPKGGCGKTTIAVNLAGYFAREGRRVILADLDRQRCALRWLARRPARLPTIHAWDGRDGENFRFPFEPEVVVLDAPAGQRGARLKDAIAQADRVLIPVQPSPYDMDATRAFLGRLSDLKPVRKGRRPLGLIGSRVHPRALSASELKASLGELGLPLLGLIRDTQLYVRMAAEGTTLFDLPRYRAARDMEQWQGILDWLERQD